MHNTTIPAASSYGTDEQARELTCSHSTVRDARWDTAEGKCTDEYKSPHSHLTTALDATIQSGPHTPVAECIPLRPAPMAIRVGQYWSAPADADPAKLSWTEDRAAALVAVEGVEETSLGRQFWLAALGPVLQPAAARSTRPRGRVCEKPDLRPLRKGVTWAFKFFTG
jgi:hypothetical protein